MAQVWECTNAEYHADRIRTGSTMLKVALRSLPEFKRRYRDDPPLVDEPSPARTLGSLVHCLVLEPEKYDSLFSCRPPGIDGRTKNGKEELAAFRLSAIGKQEITGEVLKQAQSMADSLCSEPIFAEMLSDGIKERAVVWDDYFGADLEVIHCKCKPDLFVPRPDRDADLIVDVKTADDPTPSCFGSGSSFSPIRKYKYALQGYHYCRGVEELTGKPCTFGLAVVGSSDPFDTYIYDLGEWLKVGAREWTEAMWLINQAKVTNWRMPLQGQVVALSPTEWDFREV
jgi:exodeoxyribonuclease VIII